MQTIAWISSLLLALCGLPELIATIRTKKVNLTWAFLLMWWMGEVFGSIYTIYIQDYALIANYALNTMILSYLLVQKSKKSLRRRKNDRARKD